MSEASNGGKSEKKVALVTGGMGGIGTAICRAFHAAGCAVATTYIHDSGRETRWVEAQAAAGFPGIEPFYCDIASWDDCVKLREAALGKMGRVDVLVNNAGITRDSVFLKMTPEQWNEVVAANLTGVFNVTRQFADGMASRGWGRIVNISSINAQKGQFGQCNYSAAKAGMHGFTKALAQELARKGVTVNTVSPGYIATDMVMKVKEEIREKIKSQIPVGRFGEPEEIARLVLFLSAEESGTITGANFSANGGQHMY